jgi:NADPH:quinone reductase-like Zn-dependent oxidoreductase
MRAAVLRETGGPEVLRVEDVARPEPGDGEVLVRVRAASINPIDWKQRRGLSPKDLPAVLGNDISGTVEKSRADGFKPGDDVFGFSPRGGYSELATAPAAAIAKKPTGVSHEQAAALPVSGLTAWQALFDRGALQDGQTLLVAGAAGGVGHLAVQLGKHAGARLIGTGSGRNREFVLALGADEYVDYASEDVGEIVGGVDVAFDTVGGATTQTLVPTVRDFRAELLSTSVNQQQLVEIGELVASGEVRVEIAGTFALDDVAEAHELSEAGHTRGKLILTL